MKENQSMIFPSKNGFEVSPNSTIFLNIQNNEFLPLRTETNRTHFSIAHSYQTKPNLENKFLEIISLRSKILAKTQNLRLICLSEAVKSI